MFRQPTVKLTRSSVTSDWKSRFSAVTWIFRSMIRVLSLFRSCPLSAVYTQYVEQSPSWEMSSLSFTQRNVSSLIEPCGSLTHSQEASTGSCPEPNESNSEPETLFFFYIVIPFTLWSLEWSLSFRFSTKIFNEIFITPCVLQFRQSYLNPFDNTNNFS